LQGRQNLSPAAQRLLSPLREGGLGMNVGGVLGTERIGWPLPMPRFSTVG